MVEQGEGERPDDLPASYFCAVCLHAVQRSKARRQAHHDDDVSGDGVAVWLLRCPTCGLALSADVVQLPPMSAEEPLSE